MNQLIQWLNDWSDAWLTYVVHAGWQGALVGGILLAVVFVGRRWPAPLRHGLLLVALVKFLTPPFVALPSGVLSYVSIAGENGRSVLRDTHALDPPESVSSQGPVDSAQPVQTNDHELQASDARISRSELSHSNDARAVRDSESDVETRHTATPVDVPQAQSLGWSAYLLLVHIAGSLVVVATVLWQSLYLRRLLKRGDAIGHDDLLRRYALIGERLGMQHLPGLLTVPNAPSPFSCGVWRKAIVVPRRLVERASQHEIDLVLAHELAHHRRGDLVIAWLQAAVQILWWFHPVVWLINRQVRAVREDCCDDLLLAAGVADADVYCETLLHVARSAGTPRGSRLALAMACQEHTLARRFRRLMDRSIPRVGRLSKSGYVVAMLVAAAALPGVSPGHQTDEASPNDSKTDNKRSATASSTNAGSKERTTNPETAETNSDRSASETSRAWYILSQTDTAGLLNGLPQRLLQASSKERRSSPIWQGVDNGASVKIRIETEGNVNGEILVGFFKDVNWEAAEPVQVRSFPGPGEYSVDRLLPGKYWLGALVGTVEDFAKAGGSLPEGAGLGVDRNWPKPIELKAGPVSAAHVRVSNKYQLEANQNEQFRGHFGLWGAVNPDRLMIVKTVDGDGKSVPFCNVTLSELVRGDDTKIDRFHGFGTDDHGQLYCDKFTGRFRVTARKEDFIPELFAVRGRSRQFPAVYQVAIPTIIQVPVDPTPSGSATLSGRVHDQHGKPLRTFYMTLDRSRERGPFDRDYFWITMPFTSDTGSYSIPGLPPGNYTVGIRHFDYPTHVYRTSDVKHTVTIPDEPNAVIRADFEVEAKELFYGRAVFEDGAPVTKGGWVARFGATRSGREGNSFSWNVEEDGTFRVVVSAEEKRKINKYFQGTVEVWAYVGDRQQSRVDVPLEKLSRDANKPATVVLPSKPVAKEPATSTNQDEGPAPDALAWISDLRVLGEKERTLQLSDFKGKPMLLNLFGPWCAECVEKMPELVKLHEEYAGKGLVMLAICRGEDTNWAAEYLQKHELLFPVAVDADGFAVDFFRRGHSEPNYPTNVVLDRTGKRRLRQVGFEGNNLKDLNSAIEQAFTNPQ